MEPIDTMWMLVCGALVMFMQTGFAMVEAGCVRVINVQNILMKNLLDVVAGTLFWWMFGFGLAFGYLKDENGNLTAGNSFSGNAGFFGARFFKYCDTPECLTRTGESPVPNELGDFQLAMWFFQWTFSATAATIVSGGVAERVKSWCYFTYSCIMSGFIYPVIVAWTWSGNGFLVNNTSGPNYYDFAGSGIVHLTGGVGALVGALILGPRKGRFEEGVDQSQFDPHSIPLIVLGTLILWFGWFGFNGGSTLTINSHENATLAALACVNTVLGGAAGGFTVFWLRYIFMGRLYDVGGICNGILAGLVSITAGCGNVETGAAVGIGFMGACIYQMASSILRSAGVDDPIDAFPVHGCCGFWGIMAACIFDFAEGFGYWSGATYQNEAGVWVSGHSVGDQIGQNLFAAACIIGWTAGWSALIFGVFRVLGMYRVSEEIEVHGYDQMAHSPRRAYNDARDVSPAASQAVSSRFDKFNDNDRSQLTLKNLGSKASQGTLAVNSAPQGWVDDKKVASKQSSMAMEERVATKQQSMGVVPGEVDE